MLPAKGSANEPPDLQKSEWKLKELFARTGQIHSDFEKSVIADSLSDLLYETLQMPGSFDYPFSLLNSLGKIKSQDQKIRIYTWNIPDLYGTNACYGFLQYKTTKNSEFRVLRLTDKKALITDPAMATLTADNWYGSLIYAIIEKKLSGITCYTLLGYNPENLFISKKIIDILWFNDQDEPVWGKAVFRYQNRLQNRILFEYSAKVNMSLQWNQKMNMIIFDHLSPSKPSYTGNYQFYGPDFSYDGLEVVNGYWDLVEDIDIRNK